MAAYLRTRRNRSLCRHVQSVQRVQPVHQSNTTTPEKRIAGYNRLTLGWIASNVTQESPIFMRSVTELRLLAYVPLSAAWTEVEIGSHLHRLWRQHSQIANIYAVRDGVTPARVRSAFGGMDRGRDRIPPAQVMAPAFANRQYLCGV